MRPFPTSDLSLLPDLLDLRHFENQFAAFSLLIQNLQENFGAFPLLEYLYAYFYWTLGRRTKKKFRQRTTNFSFKNTYVNIFHIAAYPVGLGTRHSIAGQNCVNESFLSFIL